ncbi:MAG TPA: YciI family protein [Pseudolabrys sp.]|nr:YciI family protein [Pseudolabrys sp.]
MLFSVHALDAPNGAAIRAKVHHEHVAHLKTQKDYGVTMVIGGPLVADDGKGSVGSLMVFEAEDRASVEKFNRADPFHKNGVWAKVEIQRFEKLTG